MNFPILFIKEKENYLSGKEYIFKDFMMEKLKKLIIVYLIKMIYLFILVRFSLKID